MKLLKAICACLCLLPLVAYAQAPPPSAAVSAVSDLKNWPSGLPCAATWCIGTPTLNPTTKQAYVAGFNLKWHCDQVRAGHRFLPSLFADINGPATVYNSPANPKTVALWLTPFSADVAYLAANGLPLCLRCNNVQDVFQEPRFHGLTPMSASPFAFGQNATTGVVSETNVVDSFGDPLIWGNEGALWPKTNLWQTLATMHPNPAWLQHIENNEPAGFDGVGRYSPDGKVWLPLDQIRAKSVRMAGWLETNPTATVSDFGAVWNGHYNNQYAAFYAGMRANLPASWQGNLRIGAYHSGMSNVNEPVVNVPSLAQFGLAPGLCPVDGGSPQQYIDGSGLEDLTALNQTFLANMVPAWEWHEAKNPKAWREFSLWPTHTALLKSWKAGIHLPISPAIYQGWIECKMWMCQKPGVPFVVRAFFGSSKLPTTPFFLPTDGAPADMANLTFADYVYPLAAACDRICMSPTVRQFWLHGTPMQAPGPTPTSILLKHFGQPAYPPQGFGTESWRVLPVDCNTPAANWVWDGQHNQVVGSNKVWAIPTKLISSSGPQYQIFLFSPCDPATLPATVKVTVPEIGDVSLPPPSPTAYWVLQKTAGGTVSQKRVL